ncbi:hypothetical protein COW36_07435 [bacterium (Candidatus Blackallbacteria) CG17_big_fil_post_rev_8_21_14_2_50_48_46]|uniref:Uncharacterized protein n=1 Tax=bacterium (Candidatus Blackallbacteria) CG17_big_fil_post_rev_8_21_14_2_50_48_46 TaxID=2014261 RepID=A0A2M7G6T9_9BACT|nr:MAG: hypothetical protein COW64_16535 [bacterium (Candidatus Blackallbacteria) CG18_big_fil_WC_8_21_14_2_50_49_26]PIW17768.1 MAG: hypothetical protein COW36_07435 [bacterium (Candidatus Blackallbacteria) CG17_big_fil_post_rev_8_21_14_2_50_48_46]PIW47327.1 MAG: hypothetical protein COW20_12960 [bacterium (Candidatus Blackallbacteria) CG13_big_fil_rev_8_21_14_2_50_49_14]
MRQIFLALMLAFGMVFPAFASDPNGWWTSSTGSYIQLWANMEQVFVTVHPRQGQPKKYQGYWTRFSDAFVYSVPGYGSYQVSFSDPNKILVRDAKGGVTVWVRGKLPRAPQQQQPMYQQQAPQQPPPQQQTPQHWNLNGLWTDGSGTHARISIQGSQIFVKIQTADGTMYDGGGYWLAQHAFTFNIPSISDVYTCQVDPGSGRMIRIVSTANGQTMTWQKVQ